MPPAQATEFAFAASGTCLTAGQGQSTYLASGGIDPPRILVSQDRGHTWTATTVPLIGGPSAGVFSVQFRDRHNGIAVGGDFANPTSSLGNAAWSSDGGLTWRPATARPSGYRSGSAWVPNLPTVALAVGPSGSDVTIDAGRTWSVVRHRQLRQRRVHADLACWASGRTGPRRPAGGLAALIGGGRERRAPPGAGADLRRRRRLGGPRPLRRGAEGRPGGDGRARAGGDVLRHRAARPCGCSA